MFSLAFPEIFQDYMRIVLTIAQYYGRVTRDNCALLNYVPRKDVSWQDTIFYNRKHLKFKLLKGETHNNFLFLVRFDGVNLLSNWENLVLSVVAA